VIRRAEELKAAEAKELVAKLAEGNDCPLPEGTYVSVSWADKKFPPQGLKIPKSARWIELKECKKVYERDAKEFLWNYAKSKGLEITADGVSALISRLGTDLSLITSEVDKLITYMGDATARATGEDVRRAIGEAAHEGVSDLITAMISGGSSRAMHLVRQFRDSSEPRIPNQLMLAAISSELRLMIAIQEKLSKGYSILDTVREVKSERELRTPEFILERTVNLAKRLGPEKAMQMLIRLGEADRQMKGGTGLSDTVLGEDVSFETAVIDLCAMAKRQ
jgi:DNA polymerase-3 subunit delta